MGKRLKVLFIAKNIPRPGKKTNKIIYKIAENLSEFCDISFLRPREIIPFWLRHNPKFADLYGLKGWKYKQYKITTYPYIHLPFKKANYWLLNKLSASGKKFVDYSGKFDLIHAHYLFPDGYIAYKISQKYGIPYIITVRSQDKQYLGKISKKNPDYKKAAKILKHAGNVLVTNLAYKNFFDGQFDIKCKIVPHGIERDVFEIPVLDKKDDKVIITTIADTLKTKNVDWVIRAFKDYKGHKDIVLRIIGDVIPRAELIKLADNDKRIKFFGRLPRQQVLELLRESDIFALPSSRETFGLVYLEAAATKNAIIGYKGEGVWGVFEDHREMLFCDHFEEFKEKLFFALDNAEGRTSLQTNAFLKAKEMEWENIENMYLKIYKKAIDKENDNPN